MSNMITEFKAQSTKWKRFRMNYITGTDCASLFQLNPNQSKNVVIKDKTSDTVKKSFDNKYAQAGRMLEGAVVVKLNEYGYKVKSAAKEGRVTVLHNNLTKLSSSLDAVYTVEKRKYITEIKTTVMNNWTDWIQNGLPLTYLLQTQIQIILRPDNVENSALLALMGGKHPDYPLAIYKIFYNPEIQTIVENEVARFWENPELFDYDQNCKERLKELLPATAVLLKIYDFST